MCAKGPRLRDVPDLGDVLANAGVEVLEVAAEAFGSEGSPGNELIHAAGVFVPFIPFISFAKGRSAA